MRSKGVKGQGRKATCIPKASIKRSQVILYTATPLCAHWRYYNQWAVAAPGFADRGGGGIGVATCKVWGAEYY